MGNICGGDGDNNKTPKVKSGYLNIFGSYKWRLRYFVLHEDAELVWYQGLDREKMKGRVYLKEVRNYFVVGPLTECLPNCPKLPRGVQNHQNMIAVPDIPSKHAFIHWILCADQKQFTQWITAICSTLPPPPYAQNSQQQQPNYSGGSSSSGKAKAPHPVINSANLHHLQPSSSPPEPLQSNGHQTGDYNSSTNAALMLYGGAKIIQGLQKRRKSRLKSEETEEYERRMNRRRSGSSLNSADNLDGPDGYMMGAAAYTWGMGAGWGLNPSEYDQMNPYYLQLTQGVSPGSHPMGPQEFANHIDRVEFEEREMERDERIRFELERREEEDMMNDIRISAGVEGGESLMYGDQMHLDGTRMDGMEYHEDHDQFGADRGENGEGSEHERDEMDIEDEHSDMERELAEAGDSDEHDAHDVSDQEDANNLENEADDGGDGDEVVIEDAGDDGGGDDNWSEGSGGDDAGDAGGDDDDDIFPEDDVDDHFSSDGGGHGGGGMSDSD